MADRTRVPAPGVRSASTSDRKVGYWSKAARSGCSRMFAMSCCNGSSPRLRRFQLQKLYEIADGCSTSVHIRLRLGQHDVGLLIASDDRDQTAEAISLVLPPRPKPPRQLVHSAEPDVVPRIYVLGPWIAEP